MFFFFLISYRRLAYIESIIRSSWRSHDAEQKLTLPGSKTTSQSLGSMSMGTTYKGKQPPANDNSGQSFVKAKLRKGVASDAFWSRSFLGWSGL